GGRIETVADAVARANSFGWQLDRPTSVCVVELDEQHDARAQERLAALVAAVVRPLDPGAAVVDLTRTVGLLLRPAPDHARDPVAEQVTEHLQRARHDARIPAFSVGVSRVAPTVADVPTAYDQALRAVRIGRRIAGPGSATHFDDLGAFRLLSLVPDQA